MKYTSIEEKDQIRIAFKELLKEYGYTLRSFCNTFNYPYVLTSYKMRIGSEKYHIDDMEVRKMIGRIDDCKRLTNETGIWTIM